MKKMKKFKRTMPLQEVTEYNPISRAYDWQENPVEKADSKCTVSTQKKPLDECDYYSSYSQQENLVEPDDIDFTVPARKVQQIERTSSAVEHSSRYEKAVISLFRVSGSTQEVQRIEANRSTVKHAASLVNTVSHLNPAFFRRLKNTYAQAYILYMNGNAKNAKHRNSRYLKSLYYRSVEAGARLYAAEKECLKAVAELQLSNGGPIDSIAKCQSMIAKLRIGVWENARMLKIYIYNSGPEGRAWYEALEKNHSVKYVR